MKCFEFEVYDHHYGFTRTMTHNAPNATQAIQDMESTFGRGSVFFCGEIAIGRS